MLRLKSMAEAIQLPIRVTIGEEIVEVPLFDLNDFIRWGSIVDQQREEAAVRGASIFERTQLLAFYRIVPSDVTDLKNRVGSPTGTRYVVTTCYKKAKVVGRMEPGKEEPTMYPQPVPFDEPRKVMGPNGEPALQWPKIDALFAHNSINDLRDHAFQLADVPLAPKVDKKEADDELKGENQEGEDDPLT